VFYFFSNIIVFTVVDLHGHSDPKINILVNISPPGWETKHCVFPGPYFFLGFSTELVGSWLPTFWNSLSVPSSRVKRSNKNGKDGLSRNVNNQVQTYCA